MDARSLSSLGKQLSRTDSDPRLRPEDQYEILCNEAVLPLDMTLASVRQFIWRQSGELVMYYRRKKTVHGLQPPVPPVMQHRPEHHNAASTETVSGQGSHHASPSSRGE